MTITLALSEAKTVAQHVADACQRRVMRDNLAMRHILHYLAVNGVADILRALLVSDDFRKNHMNDQDSDEMTPLHLAVIGNHPECVRLLVNNFKANVHCRDLSTYRPTHPALVMNNVAQVEVLAPHCQEDISNLDAYYAKQNVSSRKRPLTEET